jgi:cardiolipin synthase A/B
MFVETELHPLSGRLKPGGELRHDAAGAAVLSKRLGDEHTEPYLKYFCRGSELAHLSRVLERRTHRLDRLRDLRYHHKLVFSVLIVAGILAAIVLFAKDRETLEIVSEYDAQDANFPAYIAALSGAQATGGNKFDVLDNGDAFFPPMLDAIKSAKARISLETYIYDKGRVADQFTDALLAAARRGVIVNLVVDALGSKKMPHETWTNLRDAGVHLGNFGAPSWYKPQQMNYRTHRKVLVVDGRVAFTGGAGVADHWQGNAEDPEHWRDTMIRIEGPLVRLLEGAFYDDFVRTVRPVRPIVEPVHEAETPTGGDSAFVVLGAATGGSNDLKRVYMLAIASARRTLDICTPYFLTDKSSRWALAQARQRGVRVRVLVEGDQTDARIVKYASRDAYEELLRQGIRIYEYQPTMMHTKTMIVDDVWSMFGSANFDNRSLELNDELNVAVADRGLAQRLEANFQNDLRSARQLELDGWRQRPALEKVRERFWAFFGEIF